ncbi:hypothetical protein ACFL27_17250 [candidate division CSSED10-310 bacterium]|uniref:Uncharacterized protein n=1 Tax=candidate division CSSED10-310 bacterium TaxID=2855610 RepID=A0ABV6Z0T5_UNCC1
MMNIAASGNAGIPAGKPSHKSWYFRGYLPHLDQPGLIQTNPPFSPFDPVPENGDQVLVHDMNKMSLQAYS